ncbi:MAG: sulfatase/phosphatase domain-containing protein, partial [Planctomycetota bacterium]
EESLRSPLIVVHPTVKRRGEPTDAIVESIDIFPTLCGLTGIPMPSFTHGKCLAPLLEDPTNEGHAAVSYFGAAQTIRTPTHRLILHDDGFCELYDHQMQDAETANVAKANPAIVQRLRQQLRQRLLARLRH